MKNGRCLVVERSGAWAAALRHEFGAAGGRIVEIRSWSHLQEALQASPASIACLEAAGIPPDEFARRLAVLHDEYPAARVVVLADDGSVVHESLWRDFGVVEVATNRADLRVVATVVRRHLGHAMQADSLWDELAQSLPEAVRDMAKPAGAASAGSEI